MSLPLCDADDCKPCTYIQDLKQNPTVAACLAGRLYKKDEELTILYPLEDDSAAWHKFCREELKVPSQ